MVKKPDISKKILNLLSKKPALAVAVLAEQVAPKAPYALKRSLKGLYDAGLIEHHHSGQNDDYTRLTREGKKKAHSIKLDQDTTLVDPNWDGKWRIILLDLPESRKDERDGLRYLLKKAGFVCLKNSVWISPHPFEHLFMNIKKDLNLSAEMMIIVSDTLDKETEDLFLSIAN